MGEFMDSLVAIMGLAAGLMVTFTSLIYGEAPGQQEFHHDPRTIRPQTERMAA